MMLQQSQMSQSQSQIHVTHLYKMMILIYITHNI